MREDDLRRLAEELDLYYEVREADEEFDITCPFAPWTHHKGSDSRPSMSWKINEGGRSVYNCFACGEAGASLSFMLLRLGQYDADYRAPLSWVEPVESEILTLRHEYDEVAQTQIIKMYAAPPEEVSIIPASALERFYDPAIDKSAASTYLKGRGIRKEIVKRFEIGYDDRRQMVFMPVRWGTGEVVGGSGRSVDSDAERKHHHYWTFKKGHVLYGEWLLPIPAAPVVVVEGVFDVLRATQAGFTCVGLFGATATQIQANKLAEYGAPIIVALDSDEAGERGASKLRTLIGGRVLVSVYEWPEENMDAASYTEKNLRELLRPLVESARGVRTHEELPINVGWET